MRRCRKRIGIDREDQKATAQTRARHKRPSVGKFARLSESASRVALIILVGFALLSLPLDPKQFCNCGPMSPAHGSNQAPIQRNDAALAIGGPTGASGNRSSGEGGAGLKPRRPLQQKVKPASAQGQGLAGPQQPTARQRAKGASGGWRPTKGFRQSAPADFQPGRPPEVTQVAGEQAQSDPLQVSITPRVGLVRVPVESNAILKCLISSQADKFKRPFRVRWSRFMYDEKVHEQIESSTGLEDEPGAAASANASLAKGPNERTKRQLENGAPLMNRQQQLRDFLRRSRQETNVISDLLIEATLSISPVKASDNATYFCSAVNVQPQHTQPPAQPLDDEERPFEQRARIDLLALSRPSVRLDRVQPARDSKSALVFWTILSDGNTPIKKTILMVKNDSSVYESAPSGPQTSGAEAERTTHPSSVVTDQDHQLWRKIDIGGEGEPVGVASSGPFEYLAAGSSRAKQQDSDVVRASLDVDVTSPADSSHESHNIAGPDWPPRVQAGHFEAQQQRAFNLSSLLPGVTYQLKLAAINDMGQSNWSQLAATMPNEIPAQIHEVVVLSSSNDSITIGWRRPLWDQAKTVRYEMQLFDLNRTLTLDANTNTSGQQLRTNYMFHFVNLQPGTDYHFHIRACSRAGCSAYSSPKLLASTLDGEPDEPLDVELQCDGGAGGSAGEGEGDDERGPGWATVSWLPPRETRGRLLNYSIHLESVANYRNHSGHWTTDQWRSTIETNDNHTLSLELGPASSGTGGRLQAQLASGQLPALSPNTNYSVRVCANNRSKNCGKLSALTSKSQCFIPAQLPRELPMNQIRLSLAKFSPTNSDSASETSDEQHRDEENIETLQVEFPFFSWRNGSIDCVQVILIRLPRSFRGADSQPLSDFLPADPADMTLHEYIDLVAKVDGHHKDDAIQEAAERTASVSNEQQMRLYDQAFAYLAEELDSEGVWSSSLASDELASGRRRVQLGDGRQLSCRAVWSEALGAGPSQSGESGQRRPIEHSAGPPNSREATNESLRIRLQPLDGSLAEDTHYTGFLRLVQVRGARRKLDKRRAESNAESAPTSGEQVKLRTKHSYYFSPVKTGRRVPEVPLELLLVQQQQADQSGPTGQRGSVYLSLCRSQFVLDLQSKVFGSTKPCRMFSEFMDNVRKSVVNFSRALANSFSSTGSAQENSLDRLVQRANSIGAGDGPTQVLQVALVVIVFSLLILLVIYLFTLPAALRRRRRKRETRRQLDEHEKAARHAPSPPCKPSQFADETGGFEGPRQKEAEAAAQLALANGAPSELQRQMQHHHHHPSEPFACSLHTSPARHEGATQSAPDCQRRQSVHVCQAQQPQQQTQLLGSDYGTLQRTQHNHRFDHDDQAQLSQSQFHLEQTKHSVDYARNCRTMRRTEHHGLMAAENYYVQHGHQPAQDRHPQQQQQQPQPQQSHLIHPQRASMTLQHGAGGGSLAATVLALAKKINKSIPLALFHSVLDCRLRNGWLREEYEQLPRVAALVQQQLQQNGHQTPNDGKHIKLRPQLIVSRDDSVSALISGNEFYDGSLVRLQRAASSDPDSAPIERQFICAKSPLDADLVWDFWRLIYEREVSTLVMLTPNEDVHTGELRCAQYWPTCDNEETTILSPCNEHVQSSSILPAKFKIRQETVSSFGDMDEQQQQLFKVRRLTLLVMATKISENEHFAPAVASNSNTTNCTNGTLRDETGADSRAPQESKKGADLGDFESASGTELAASNATRQDSAPGGGGDDEDEEKLIIVERTLMHFQFLHWNASSASNQTKLVKFVQFVNERHSRQLQQMASPGSSWRQNANRSPILVHCANGMGRSGLFAAMSFVVDDLHFKLMQQQLMRAGGQLNADDSNQQQSNSNQQLVPKVNLFQLVARLRSQRDMLLSPYRFYELLYQLTARCIPVQQQQLQ